MLGLPGPAGEAVRTENRRSPLYRQGNCFPLDKCSPHKTHLQTEPEPGNIRVLACNITNL